MQSPRLCCFMLSLPRISHLALITGVHQIRESPPKFIMWTVVFHLRQLQSGRGFLNFLSQAQRSHFPLIKHLPSIGFQVHPEQVVTATHTRSQRWYHVGHGAAAILLLLCSHQ